MSSGQASLTIAVDHPAFAGHFPGAPIVPGVVLLDAALHAIGRQIGTDLSACRIGTMKFLRPVGPGEPVSVRYETLDSGALRFDLLSAGHKVATGSIRPPEVAAP